jgi:hypothetical protein
MLEALGTKGMELMHAIVNNPNGVKWTYSECHECHEHVAMLAEDGDTGGVCGDCFAGIHGRRPERGEIIFIGAPMAMVDYWLE